MLLTKEPCWRGDVNCPCGSYVILTPLNSSVKMSPYEEGAVSLNHKEESRLAGMVLNQVNGAGITGPDSIGAPWDPSRTLRDNSVL